MSNQKIEQKLTHKAALLLMATEHYCPGRKKNLKGFWGTYLLKLSHHLQHI
jgi:hypothetical protein